MCISFFDVVSIKIEPKQVSDSVYGTEVRGVLVFDDIRGRKSISFKLEFTFGYLEFRNRQILQAVWLLGCYFNTVEIRWNDYEFGVKYIMIYFILVGKDEIRYSRDRLN